jgi:urea transporter
MRFYTVHLRPDEEPVLLREGFSFGAAIFGPIWLFFHGAWLAGLLVLVIDALIALLPGAFGVIGALTSVWLLGLFGQDLRRWNLTLNGYSTPHVIAARDIVAAEARLLGARPELMERMP